MILGTKIAADDWARVIAAFKNVDKTYAALVDASDALAEAMAFDADRVRRQVFDTFGRCDAAHVLEWIEHRATRDDLAAALKKRSERFRRDALITRLALPPEEEALLRRGDEPK